VNHPTSTCTSAAYPTRLPADALWQSLVGVLATWAGRVAVAPGRGSALGMRQGGFEGLFKSEFSFDPSLRPDEVEGSIPQALMMMNTAHQ